jgi:hypothetical protein
LKLGEGVYGSCQGEIDSLTLNAPPIVSPPVVAPKSSSCSSSGPSSASASSRGSRSHPLLCPHRCEKVVSKSTSCGDLNPGFLRIQISKSCSSLGPSGAFAPSRGSRSHPLLCSGQAQRSRGQQVTKLRECESGRPTLWHRPCLEKKTQKPLTSQTRSARPLRLFPGLAPAQAQSSESVRTSRNQSITPPMLQRETRITSHAYPPTDAYCHTVRGTRLLGRTRWQAACAFGAASRGRGARACAFLTPGHRCASSHGSAEGRLRLGKGPARAVEH